MAQAFVAQIVGVICCLAENIEIRSRRQGLDMQGGQQGCEEPEGVVEQSGALGGEGCQSLPPARKRARPQGDGKPHGMNVQGGSPAWEKMHDWAREVARNLILRLAMQHGESMVENFKSLRGGKGPRTFSDLVGLDAGPPAS